MLHFATLFQMLCPITLLTEIMEETNYYSQTLDRNEKYIEQCNGKL